jgi:membrane dipeptidase
MDCCGHEHGLTPRAPIWSMALPSAGAMLAGGVGPPGSTAAARTAETTSSALDVLRKTISVDVHTHGGKTGISSKAPPSGDLASAMRAGSLAVACLADVPDGPILGRNAEGALAVIRTPEPGQLYRHHLERLAWMDAGYPDRGTGCFEAQLQIARELGDRSGEGAGGRTNSFAGSGTQGTLVVRADSGDRAL